MTKIFWNFVVRRGEGEQKQDEGQGVVVVLAKQQVRTTGAWTREGNK